MAEADTPDIVSSDQFRWFWVAWGNDAGWLEVGKGDILRQNPLLYTDIPDPQHLRYVGLSTGYDFDGDWEFHESQG